MAKDETKPVETKKLMVEVAPVRSDLYEAVSEAQKNWRRDDGVEQSHLGKAGADFQYPFGLYQRTMQRDAHLRALWNLRVAALLARPWEIVPAIDDDSQAGEIADFVREVFDYIGTGDTTEGSGACTEEGFEQDRKELMAALPYGFSVFEVMWEVRESKLWINRLLHRHNRRFTFDLKTNAPRLLTKDHTTEGVELPPYKFMVGVYAPEFENPFGYPLARGSFFNSYLKLEAQKLFAFAIERQACGIAWVTYDPEGAEGEDKKAKKIVEGLQRGVGAAVPKSLVLEFHNAAISGTSDAIEKFMDYCDQANTKLWLGGTLNVDQGDVGSYALGKVHADKFRQLIEADAKWMCAVYNNQLIKWLVLLNYGEEAAATLCPTFQISMDDEPDSEKLMNLVESAVKLGLKVPTSYFREMFAFPTPEEGEEVIEYKALPTFGVPPGEEDEEDEEPEPKKKLSEADTLRFAETPHKSAPNLVKTENLAVKHGDKVYEDLRKQVTDWLNGFSSIGEAANSTKPVITDRTSLEQYLTRVWIAAGVAGYNDLLADLKRRSKPFSRAYTKSKRERQSFLPTISLAGAEAEFIADADKPVAVEALRNLEKRAAMDRQTFDRLTDIAKPNALTAAGLTEYTIDTRLRDALNEAIREGLTIQEFRKEMADLPFLNDAHRNTVYRTNVQSAYSAGRWEMGQDPDVASYFPAARIEAVLDERTSDICRQLHGTLISRAELDAGQMVPPFHYNCRSVLVYLTVNEMADKIAEGTRWSRLEDSPALDGFGRVMLPETPIGV